MEHLESPGLGLERDAVLECVAETRPALSPGGVDVGHGADARQCLGVAIQPTVTQTQATPERRRSSTASFESGSLSSCALLPGLAQPSMTSAAS